MRCPLSNQFYNFFLLAYSLEWNYHFQMRDILKSRLLSLLKLVSYQDWVGFSYMYLAPWVVLMQCGFFFFPKCFPERSFWMMQTKIFFFISFCCKERLPTAGHSCANRHLYHTENRNLTLWDSSFQGSCDEESLWGPGKQA